MSNMTIDHIRSIIVRQLDLGEDRVMMFNSKFQAPKDDDLFVAISFTSSAPISNRIQYNADTGLEEAIKLLTDEIITISICSRSFEAMRRKEEVAMAMMSTYAQGLMEKHGFKINRLSRIMNLSSIEGAAMLNRFDIIVNVIASYIVEKNVEYYDSFNGRLLIDPDEVIDFET